MVEISLKMQIDIQKYKIYQKKSILYSKFVRFFENSTIRNSKTPENLENSSKKSRFRQIQLVIVPKTGRQKPLQNAISNKEAD